MSAIETLSRGAHALGLTLPPDVCQRLLDYQSWVVKWNRVYNLTAVREPQEMLVHHLLDSLAVVPSLQRHVQSLPNTAPVRVLDVGSGAGLPGAVLAIVCPQWEVSCVDTVAKKALFIEQVAASLRVVNLHGVHARVEQLTETFDVVTSRAFASLSDFTRWSANCVPPSGVWVAMKGKHPHEEIAGLPPEVEVFHVEPLQVPGLEAERCAVWMRRASKKPIHCL